MEHYKISKLLNDPTLSKFVTKNGSKQMIYQVVSILLTKNKVSDFNVKIRFMSL